MMKNWVIFLFGVAGGYVLNEYVTPVSSAPIAEVRLSSGQNAGSQQTTCHNQESPDLYQLPEAETSQTTQMTHQQKKTETNPSQLLKSTANTTDLFSSQQFQDLSYLIKKDPNLASQVRENILNSQSYDQKWKLINVLANDQSPETIHFAADMIQGQNDAETQKLGLELISLMGFRQLPASLSDALLDASYQEGDPEVLEQVINQLSQQSSESYNNQVSNRLQSFLSDDNHQIKAAAIDGLAEVSEPDQIQETARSFLSDPDEMIRNAAINSLFKLPANKIDPGLITALQQLQDDPSTTDSSRRLAAAVLEAM